MPESPTTNVRLVVSSSDASGGVEFDIFDSDGNALTPGPNDLITIVSVSSSIATAASPAKVYDGPASASVANANIRLIIGTFQAQTFEAGIAFIRGATPAVETAAAGQVDIILHGFIVSLADTVRPRWRESLTGE